MKCLLSLLLFPLFLAGCKDQASFNTVEDARAQAIDNSMFNARKYRTENEKFAGWNIIKRGDSTISADCPQGDGWASIDLELDGKTIPLKCSTVSINLGCMTKGDFSKKVYAAQEGRCDTKLPHPLPKIVE